jgi:hypothetical protein
MTALPQHGKQLLYILDNFCNTDADTLAAVKAYHNVMQYVVDCRTGPTLTGLALLECWNDVSKVWCTLHARLEDLHSTRESKFFPSLDTVITELREETPLLGPIELREIIPGYTFWSHPHELHVLTVLAASSPDHQNIVESILISQPQYQTTSTDTDDERRASIFAEPYFKEKLVETLALFHNHWDREHDVYDNVSGVLQFFRQLTGIATLFVEQHDYKYNRAAFLTLRDRIQEETRQYLCLPFTDQHILVRTAIAKLDIGAVLSALVHRAFQILLDHPVRQELLWRLHHLLYQSAMMSPAPKVGFNAVEEVIQNQFGAAQFLDANAVPIANYRSNLDLSEQPEVFGEEEFIPAELTDVAREPIGPRRQPSICSAHATVLDLEPDDICTICSDDFADASSGTNPPMLLNCPHGHVFHYDCLENLINGIASYSNLCPNCRTVVCSARPSRPVLPRADSNMDQDHLRL